MTEPARDRPAAEQQEIAADTKPTARVPANPNPKPGRRKPTPATGKRNPPPTTGEQNPPTTSERNPPPLQTAGTSAREPRKPALAASSHGKEREREREMRQTADASSYQPLTEPVQNRHVCPSRTHAKPTPSNLRDQSLSQGTPVSAEDRPNSRNPNQTLCLLETYPATQH
jgi:hypothetical protein